MIRPILVIVLDENGGPRLSSRPFLFEDDYERERNVEMCMRYGWLWYQPNAKGDFTSLRQ